MTKFKVGNKLGGKTKGSLNKVTQEIREYFKLLVQNNLEQLQEDIATLEPKDRVKAILDIASFVTPKLKAIDLKTDANDTRPILLNLGNGIAPVDLSNKEFNIGEIYKGQPADNIPLFIDDDVINKIKNKDIKI